MDMKPVRADIVGAESLVICKGEGSRADHGTFLKDGLYKIDKDGNISAMGIFLKKNGSTKEEELVCEPWFVNNIGKTYVVISASFFTKRGGSLFQKDMLVNKKTGRIFELSSDLCRYGMETSANTLLMWDSDNGSQIGRVTITGDDAVYKQLNEMYHGFEGGQVKELANGTILSQGEDSNNVAILFPNGGYDYLNDVVGGSNYGLMLNDGCAALKAYDRYWNHVGNVDERAEWYNVKVGNRPGEFEVDLIDEIDHASYGMKYMGYYETTNNVVAYGYVLDKTTNKLNVLDIPWDIAQDIKVSEDRYFAGRMWNLARSFNWALGEIKVVWFNPETLESGKLDVNLGDVDIDTNRIEPFYTAGKIVVYGVRRSDSSSVVATVDLVTEKAEIILTPPSWATIQLIPLN